MIDETQDFDMIMLKMLLNDTTIPKIFVGDPKQSIYDFRGCINAFNYLPNEALVIEFYSTFRVGNPACEIIRSKFNDCWMVSKSINETHFIDKFDDNEKYVYLFRSWRVLLQTAEKTNNIWIYNFDKKINEIRNLHKKLQNRNNFDEDDDKFEDDLPKFLTSITSYQLEQMLNNITNNIVNCEDSIIQFYTTHSYKGMENNNIRLANDIDLLDDENIYYVAITRGMKKIIIDK
jgi:superfamily I DNA/RNA helicase